MKLVLYTLASLFLLRSHHILLHEYSFKNPISQPLDDQIVQVRLTLANGYSGETSIVITKDSIHFESYIYKAKYDTLTSKELWNKIITTGNIDDFSKTLSGTSNQDRDDTDTIYSITTKFKKQYSFTNGYGEKFKKQQEFLSILTRELFSALIRALTIEDN